MQFPVDFWNLLAHCSPPSAAGHLDDVLEQRAWHWNIYGVLFDVHPGWRSPGQLRAISHTSSLFLSLPPTRGDIYYRLRGQNLWTVPLTRSERCALSPGARTRPQEYELPLSRLLWKMWQVHRWHIRNKQNRPVAARILNATKQTHGPPPKGERDERRSFSHPGVASPRRSGSRPVHAAA